MNSKNIRSVVSAILAVTICNVSMSQSAEYNKFRDEVYADYNNYRDSVYQRYEDFKKQVLDHYADFLNGEWHEFESVIVTEERLPNPDVPPVAADKPDNKKNTPVSVCLPDPKFGPALLPGLSKAPDVPARVKTIDLSGRDFKTNYEMAAYKIPDPGFAFGPYPGQIMAPLPGESSISVPEKLGDAKFEPQHQKLEDSDSFDATLKDNTSAKVDGGKLLGNGKAAPAKFDFDKFSFDFYGMLANVPECQFEIRESLPNLATEAGNHWKKLEAQKNSLEASRQLFGLAQEMGLNGYLTYRLVEHYVNAKFPEADLSARISTVHYLLSQMGYDARLSLLGRSFPVILMPFDQTEIYGLMSTQFGNSGKKYWVLPPLGYSQADLQRYGTKIVTPPIAAANTGKSSDLRLTGLNLPMKAKAFEFNGGGMQLKGEVNENLMAMIYRYPQMPIGDYASSWLDNDLRKDLILQVKLQLMGLTEKDAINKLMSFFHFGFKYCKDDEYHGFEKPYFIEENLYYDMNDCEDRAIFFSYLVWNVLDLPCQLIGYSNHESTAVSPTNDVSGHYYLRNGMKFFSADPTYIGSHFGDIADAYLNENPTVDKVYE